MQPILQGKPHVLLVDDDPDFSVVVAHFLQSRGFHVDIAHTSQEGLQKIAQRPDIVLLDRVLSKLGLRDDGLEICKKIKSDPDLASIPVIMLTALGHTADTIEGLHSGADDYLVKPFNREELVARMEAVLRRVAGNPAHQNQKFELLSELKGIIDRGAIASFFQPILSLASPCVVGVEALSRPLTSKIIPHPERLFRTALMFGKYLELEMLCWRKSLERWNGSRGSTQLFLNCSPYLVEELSLDEETLRKCGIHDPSDVTLEITELVEIRDYKLFTKKLGHFKDAGFRIAVDDVGHGFASLEMVAKLRPHYAKIDRCFVRDIHNDKLKQSIVESIISFCQKSGICTIVECVETPDELRKIIELGADAVQGYLFASPSESLDFEGAVKRLQSIR